MSSQNPIADPLDAARIVAELGAFAERFEIIALARCGSSNAELMQRAAQGARHGTVVVCDEQTAGRGRRDRTWVCTPGASLAFSILWRFGAGAAPPTGLSLAVGVALARALESFGVRKVALKWPNDVLLDGGKVAGILVELVFAQGEAAVVIGIGLNVRLPLDSPAHAWGATDIASAIDEVPTRARLLAAILCEIAVALDAFGARGFAALRADWTARHAFAGAQVRLSADHGPGIEGECVGVDNEGALLIADSAGVQRVLSGDVSLRPREGVKK